MVNKFERRKDVVQELTESTATHVGRITMIITNCVRDVTREIGDLLSDAFEMREAAKPEMHFRQMGQCRSSLPQMRRGIFETPHIHQRHAEIKGGQDMHRLLDQRRGQQLLQLVGFQLGHFHQPGLGRYRP